MIDTLRPQLLKDYVGQPKIKANLKVFLEAAKDRGESLDHALFYGPPGLGKTTIAYVIANEMAAPMQSVSGPTLEKPGDLVSLLTNQQEGGVLFIDEIHRVPRVVEEFLYSAMEDFQIDLIIGEGESAQTIKLDIPRFTLIGATTRAGMLTAPLRDRFGIVCRMEYYTEEELVHIVNRSASLMGIVMTKEGALEVARRSRSTPRIANRLLRRVRDFAEVKGDGTATKEMADLALSALEIDSRGLDHMDQQVLLTIMEKFSGGPVGLETLAAVVGEEKDTLEDVVEPYLMQHGFLNRTPRGRTVTEAAYRHFGRSRSGFLIEA